MNEILYKQFEIETMGAFNEAALQIDKLYIREYVMENYDVYEEGVIEAIGDFFKGIIDAIKKLIVGTKEEDPNVDETIKKLSKEQKEGLSGKTVKAFDHKKFIDIVENYSNSIIKGVQAVAKLIDPKGDTKLSFEDKASKNKKLLADYTKEFEAALKKGKFITKIPATQWVNSKEIRKPSAEIVEMVNKIAENTVKKLESIAKSTNVEAFVKFVMSESTKYSNNISKAIKAANKSNSLLKTAAKVVGGVVVTGGVATGVVLGTRAIRAKRYEKKLEREEQARREAEEKEKESGPKKTPLMGTEKLNFNKQLKSLKTHIEAFEKDPNNRLLEVAISKFNKVPNSAQYKAKFDEFKNKSIGYLDEANALYKEFKKMKYNAEPYVEDYPDFEKAFDVLEKATRKRNSSLSVANKLCDWAEENKLFIVDDSDFN